MVAFVSFCIWSGVVDTAMVAVVDLGIFNCSIQPLGGARLPCSLGSFKVDPNLVQSQVLSWFGVQNFSRSLWGAGLLLLCDGDSVGRVTLEGSASTKPGLAMVMTVPLTETRTSTFSV